MPYIKEIAGKTSHADIVKNPEVASFLSRCEYLREPSDEDLVELRKKFLPLLDESVEVEAIVSTDGSPYEASISEELPSTKVGYLKVTTLHIDVSSISALRTPDRRFIDPMMMARLQEDKDSLVFIVPSQNLRYGGNGSVRAGFRQRVDEELKARKTRFKEDQISTSLRGTLFYLSSLRQGSPTYGDANKLSLPRCPTECGETNIIVRDVEEQQSCPRCGEAVYPSDVLRIWEEVTEYQSNNLALTRLMMVVEHLMPVHLLRNLVEQGADSKLLGGLAFFVDGPLAVFGTAAWLSKPIQKFYASINQRQREQSEKEVLVIGLQKSGQLVEYLNLVKRHLVSPGLAIVDDKFRYKYVISNREESASGFGDETYYGQDFLLLTPSGKRFVLATTYPFLGKDPKDVFHKQKSDISKYDSIWRAVNLVTSLETDLYQDAIIPIALAHRFTSISLSPGGKVLDILSKGAFGRRQDK